MDETNANSDPYRVPTLGQLCEEILFKLSIHDILISYAHLSDSGLATVEKLKPYLEKRFGTLVEKYDECTLIEYLGESVYNEFKESWDKSQQSCKIFKCYVGAVLEPTQPTIPTYIQSSYPNGYYPYEQLIEGVIWPSDVNPSCREQHLIEDDFISVFDMTKEGFNKLKNFQKIRLKKEKKLF